MEIYTLRHSYDKIVESSEIDWAPQCVYTTRLQYVMPANYCLEELTTTLITNLNSQCVSITCFCLVDSLNMASEKQQHSNTVKLQSPTEALHSCESERDTVQLHRFHREGKLH